jgi:L-arabinose transport system substrate-binding protein
MKMKMKRTLFAGLILLFAAASVFAGGSKQSAGAKKLKIGYISKMLTDQWFSVESQGLADACKDLGMDYVAIDANFSDEANDAAVDNLIAQEVDGLAICITNQGNGPSVARKCREAGIPLITIDDNFVDENGKPVPHVGMPVIEVGEAGGATLAQYANDRNFFASGNVVKLLQLDVPSVSVFAPRLQGFKNSVLKGTPLKESDIIKADTTHGNMEDCLPVLQSTIQAHPEVTHWIAGFGNDEGAAAAVKVFEEAGISRDRYLVCGIGGYALAREEFTKGNNSFMTVAMDPGGEGYAAVKILYDYIVNKKPMPETTFINGKVATLSNWKELVK